MIRSILFDTETTGLDPLNGDRVIEVAALELLNDLPTGKHFHALIDPQRDIPAEASRIHGFSNGDLVGKPLFAEIAGPLAAFFADSKLIAHNAPFDFGFLDAELRRAGHKPLDRARMVDSLALAKRRFPGMPNSLDSLCRRLGVDNSMRTSHNALLDVKLLAQVYLELMGGKQPVFQLAAGSAMPAASLGGPARERVARPIEPSEAELAAHAEFLKKLKDPLWLQPPFATGEG
jgi:DNA polymerase III subunit epsilon